MIWRAAATVAVALTCLGTTSVGVRSHGALQPTVPDVLKKSIAHYATLTSYADTGTVTVDTGGTVTDARFTTYFRRPTRDLFFDFQTRASLTVSTKFKIDMSQYRTVVWMFKGEMQKYDRYTGTHERVPADSGAQVRALQGTSYATSGASIMIPSLLYSQARLPSALLQIERAELAGIEEINGRRCHKVTGVAAAYYPSGQRTGVRPVAVWIDAETLLIRRVLEDTPEGYGSGQAVLRYTFNYEPQAGPTIDDARFQFTPPAR